MDELLTVHILLGPNYRFDGAVQDAQVCQLLSRLILQIDHSLIPVIPIGLANNETLIPLHHERCLREQGIDETCEMVVTAAAPLRSQYITPIECQSDLRLYYQLPILKSYLLKKGDKGLLKTWKKRWFELKGKLLYYSESEESSVFINAINLHTMQYVCVGRSSLETPRGYGNCVFQVVTLHRIYHLIAPTEQERDRWVSMLSQIRRVFDATIGPPGSYTSESEGLGLSQHLRSTQDLDDQSLHFWGISLHLLNWNTRSRDFDFLPTEQTKERENIFEILCQEFPRPPPFFFFAPSFRREINVYWSHVPRINTNIVSHLFELTLHRRLSSIRCKYPHHT
eukprot:TRINITY_DN3259_c0_g1_i2.p1 TRINITY_DN3259_c0_g1~~TRINITY_DN3259_c0_g1_i2.p1  ORF type:complete len:339 (+),score=31.14 TRINITY_DN3259_c0_g1_i2:47-1063(+)